MKSLPDIPKLKVAHPNPEHYACLFDGNGELNWIGEMAMELIAMKEASDAILPIMPHQPVETSDYLCWK